MNEPKIDHELDRLLSGGGLGAPEEERVLEKVLAAVGAERSPAAEPSPAIEPLPAPRSPPVEEKPSLLERLRLWIAVPALAAATAAVAVWLAAEPAPGGRVDDEFRARGDGSGDASPAAPFDVRCLDEAGCRPGGKLVVTGRPLAEATWSAAALGPDDVLVWLFVGEAASGGQAFAYEATWPDDVAPGRYRVVLLAEAAPAAATASTDDARKARLLPLLEQHAAGTPAGPEVVVEIDGEEGAAPR